MPNTWPTIASHKSPKRKQKGISLFVIIIFVMLSMLLALWGSRTSLFNEIIVGNDADYQRAFEAAQALLQDAELDIRGETATGSTCVPDGTNGDICRRTTAYQIPLEEQEVGTLLASLEELSSTSSVRCGRGLCLKNIANQDFWNDATSLNQMRQPNVGARYGQYTGAKIGDGNHPANPILRERTNNERGGWYWIEVLPYDASAGSSSLIMTTTDTQLLSLNLAPNIVYRITALAQGLKPSTQVVLQQTYVRQKLKD